MIFKTILGMLKPRIHYATKLEIVYFKYCNLPAKESSFAFQPESMLVTFSNKGEKSETLSLPKEIG